MIRRSLSVVAVAILVALLPLAAATPAWADGEIGLSNDSVTWGSQLAQPLFDPAARWVPGDDETKTFSVRNEAADPGNLSVEISSPQADAPLASALLVEARIGTGPWVSLTAPAGGTVEAAQVLDAGASVPVQVRVQFPAESVGAQSGQLPLRIVVNLSDASTTVVAPPTDDGGGTTTDGGGDGDGTDNGGAVAGPGLLPGTGNPLSQSLVLGAALLLALGAGLVRASARRRVGTGE